MKKPTLTGIVAGVLAGVLSFGGCEEKTQKKHYQPIYQTASTQAAIRTQFSFRTNQRPKEVAIIDKNGNIISKVIEDYKPKGNLTTREYLSGGYYRGTYLDYVITEMSGEINSSRKGVNLRITPSKGAPYTEPIQANELTDKKIFQKAKFSIDKFSN